MGHPAGDIHQHTDQSGGAGSIGPARQGMSKAVKAAGLGLVIFVTVWVVTLWQWYRSQKPVNSEEVATQLVLLPVGLTVVACLAWWGTSRLRQWSLKPVDVAAVPVPSPPVPAGEAPASPQAGRLPATLGVASILAEALALPSGDDPELAWSALRSGQVRPSLDPHLQDADGLPVFTARQPELSTQDGLDAHAELTDTALPESLLRAMALIEAPLHRLLSALPGDDEAAKADNGADTATPAMSQGAPGPAFLSGVGQAGAREDALRRREQAPMLDIQVWLPEGWPDAHRTLFIDWLRLQAGAALDWARAVGSGEPRWSFEALDAPEAGWDRLLSRLNEWHADARPRLLMVLATHSLIDEAGVMALQARGELFTAQHQGGRVPGEAAAGLLLANAPMAARCAGEHPWLGMPGAARRQRSADRAGRPGSEAFMAVAQQVLGPWLQGHEAASPPPAWWCLSDADHRPGRASELFEAFQSLQPDGDAMQAVVRLGDAWGDLGMARALVPVALAASVVRQGLQPGDGAAPDPASAEPQALPAPALVGLLQCSHRRWAIPVWPAALAGLTPSPPSSPGPLMA